MLFFPASVIGSSYIQLLRVWWYMNWQVTISVFITFGFESVRNCANLQDCRETRLSQISCFCEQMAAYHMKETQTIPEFSKPLTSATFTLHRIFYCVAHTWLAVNVIDLLLLGPLLWMNLCRTWCKLWLARDALVKGWQNLIIVHILPFDNLNVHFMHMCTETSYTMGCIAVFWQFPLSVLH